MSRVTMLGVSLCLALTMPAATAAAAATQAGQADLGVERLEDIHDIQNALGYYEEYQSALEFDRVWPLFALEKSDVRWEVGPGFYVGGDAVKGALLAQEKRPNDEGMVRHPSRGDARPYACNTYHRRGR